MRFAVVGVLLALGLGCSGSTNSANLGPNSLSGTVLLDGKPADYIMIVAIGPNGTEASGPRLADGHYEIVNPPQGLLRFKFANGPPPIDSAPDNTAQPRGGIPAIYFTPKNDLKFEYSGGNKTYNIELTSRK